MPEIISYLMGWGDHFESHHYVAIYTNVIVAGLKKRYPGLRIFVHSQTAVGHVPGTDHTDETQMAMGTEDCRHIITMVSGIMNLKDQFHKYMFRSEEMAEMDLFSFMLDTYDAKANSGDEELKVQPESCSAWLRLSGRL